MVLWVIGGVAGLVSAVLLLRPLLARSAGRPYLAALAGTAASVALLGATLGLMAQETVNYVQLGLTEAGIPRNRNPPFSEEFVAAAEAAIGPADTWAVTTPDGRCHDDRYAFIWLSFRLHPAVPRCDAPDLEFFFGVSPPAGADVLEQTDTYAIVR